jgi:hypothetical protein
LRNHRGSSKAEAKLKRGRTFLAGDHCGDCPQKMQDATFPEKIDFIRLGRCAHLG